MSQLAYQVDVQQSIELIKQLLPVFDVAAELVLVGELTRYRDRMLEDISVEETAVDDSLYAPSYGRLHIPLSGKNKYALKKVVLSRIGIRTHIEEVMIERYGRLHFRAPNYFRDGAELSNWFADDLIDSLVSNGVMGIRHATRQSSTILRPRPTATAPRFVWQ